MKAFRKVKLESRETSLFQDAVAAVVTPLSKNQFIDGIFVNGAVLVTGTNYIIHKLGRAPQGWVVTDTTAASMIYRVSMDAQSIVLSASAGTQINLWIF